jgi:hypothetical protein
MTETHRSESPAVSTAVADRLSDAMEIHSLKARYCRFIDTKSWSRLRGLFAEDVRFEGFGSAPSGANLDAFLAGVSTRLADAISVHHCHTPELMFSSAIKARGIWAMADYVEWPVGTSCREAPGSRGFRGFGHYEEEYRKIDTVWVFSFLRLTRLRIDPLREDDPVPLAGPRQATPDWV